MTGYEKERAAVRARHPHIPQDPLPFDVEPVTKGKKSSRGTGQRSVGSLEKCPKCRKERIGLVRGDGQSEVIREHTRKMFGGRTERCPASGTTP